MSLMCMEQEDVEQSGVFRSDVLDLSECDAITLNCRVFRNGWRRTISWLRKMMPV